jgi:hypothetical protein
MLHESLCEAEEATNRTHICALQAAGLAHLDAASHLCLHPKYGPWFSLRALLVFDGVSFCGEQPHGAAWHASPLCLVWASPSCLMMDMHRDLTLIDDFMPPSFRQVPSQRSCPTPWTPARSATSGWPLPAPCAAPPATCQVLFSQGKEVCCCIPTI